MGPAGHPYLRTNPAIDISLGGSIKQGHGKQTACTSSMNAKASGEAGSQLCYAKLAAFVSRLALQVQRCTCSSCAMDNISGARKEGPEADAHTHHPRFHQARLLLAMRSKTKEPDRRTDGNQVHMQNFRICAAPPGVLSFPLSSRPNHPVLHILAQDHM